MNSTNRMSVYARTAPPASYFRETTKKTIFCRALAPREECPAQDRYSAVNYPVAEAQAPRRIAPQRTTGLAW